MDTVRFHFDPICPWCYQTSRWAKRLEQLGEIELDWGLFSLEVVNLKDESDPHQLQARSGPALRTAILIRERKGGAATQSDVCTTPPDYRPASTPFTLGPFTLGPFTLGPFTLGAIG